jgi:hypothetical protein
MSSASSTSPVRLKPDITGEVRLKSDIAGEVRLKPDATGAGASDNGFRASHFFILASLVAATGAVIMSRQSTPEHLVLVSLAIAASGLAAAGFYRTLSPLVTDAAAPGAEPLSERARNVIEREKLLVLRALKDLEFDRAMGKLAQQDFDEMAARLRGRALSLMKQLDDAGSGYRSIIERELSARIAAEALERQTRARAPAPMPEPESENTTSSLVAAAGDCACGTANDPDALFCKHCGTKLTAAVQLTGTDQTR